MHIKSEMRGSLLQKMAIGMVLRKRKNRKNKNKRVQKTRDKNESHNEAPRSDPRGGIIRSLTMASQAK